MEKIDKCGNCLRKTHCGGGCRGEALWYNGDIHSSAPNCPMERERNKFGEVGNE